MRAEEKVVLVTGGAGGLGAAAARMLNREGAIVVVTDLSREALNAAAIGGAETLVHDVTSEDDWTRVVAEVLRRHGRIDALVHCAGIEGSREKVGIDTPLSEWNKVLAVNLTSSFLGCKAVGKAMIERGEGSIVLLSSVLAKLGAKSGVAYGASKAGVLSLTRSFAAIGWQDGAKVRCNTILPGTIRTGMTDRLVDGIAKAAGLTLEQIEAKMKEIAPLGSRGEPDDIAHMVVYLVSDESKYMTGAEIVIDGGWTVIEEP